jgi:molybdenum cofactor cytidylyltransferase/nicotine blue oxidoreductase
VSTAVAILAAGRGSRLGGEASKPLLEWRGKPLVRWAVDAALQSSLRPVVVVVGYRGDEVRAALAGLDVVVVENPSWEEGIASSLRAALTLLTPMEDVDAVAVGLADQPLVDPATYEALTGFGADLVVPRYDGQPGNPVKLARSLWPEALELRGDVGARALMRDRVVMWFDCTGRGSAADVDTLEDLERLQQEDR